MRALLRESAARVAAAEEESAPPCGGLVDLFILRVFPPLRRSFRNKFFLGVLCYTAEWGARSFLDVYGVDMWA